MSTLTPVVMGPSSDIHVEYVDPDEYGAETGTATYTFATGYYLGCKAYQNKMYAFALVGWIAGMVAGVGSTILCYALW